MKHEQFEKPYYKTCFVTCLKPNDKIFGKTLLILLMRTDYVLKSQLKYTKLYMYGDMYGDMYIYMYVVSKVYS